MPAKLLKIDSLDLDLENPRITRATDQRDAMQKILKEQGVKLVNLAESIADRGLNPMDRLLVLRSNREGRFIVVEGNRRILAMKLLKNPSLVTSLEIPDALKKRLLRAGQSFDSQIVEPIACFEVEDRPQANEWIRQRHTGEDEGRGVVRWVTIAKSRFRGRDPALQALEFVLEYGGLSVDQQAQITEGKFPLTTLDRLLSTPNVRKAIGFDIDNGKLTTELPAREALKPLKRIVLDLALKVKTVSDLKLKGQQEVYVANFKTADRADLAQKSGTAQTIESITQKDFSAMGTATAKRARTHRPAPRTSIVPRSCKLNVTTPKILGIYEELRRLLLARHVYSIAVMLRVFLEMSVDEYLTKEAGVSLKFKDPKSGRDLDKALRNL